jgi:hypothetical protein
VVPARNASVRWLSASRSRVVRTSSAAPMMSYMISNL